MALRDSLSEVGIGWRHAHYGQMLEQRPPLDFLEVHSENFFAQGGAALATLEQGRALYPVSLHGVGLSLGSAVGLDPWHLEQLSALVERIDPIRVSDHAAFARAAYQGQTIHASDLLPLPFSRQALDVLCANVDAVQHRLKRRFMVENISAYVTWQRAADDGDMDEPAFLQDLAQRTGCLLLVDVNNIYVNALNAHAGDGQRAEVACHRWLEAIDPAWVGEIHLAGHCHVNDSHGSIVIDDHGSRVCDAVWRLFRHAIVRFGAVPTLIEWDTDVPALDVLLDEAGRARRVLDAVLCEELA
jgi:uncharacterized protein (UPF0276 family)